MPHSACMLTQDLSDTNISNPARTPSLSKDEGVEIFARRTTFEVLVFIPLVGLMGYGYRRCVA